MFVPLETGIKISNRFRGLTVRISNFFPKIKDDLVKTDVEVEADQYTGACIISAFVSAIFVFLIMFLLLYILGADTNMAILLSAIVGTIILILLFFVLLFYPGILAGKKAELIEKDLVYALKDMLLEVSAGASLYDAIVGTTRADYGAVSREFEKVVKRSNTGVPVENALEELALRTTSEYLRTAVWQMVNALKAGSNIEGTLSEIVKDLTANQRAKIKSYAQELNILALLYMLFSVVVPTIAITLIIVIGPFLGISASPEIFYIVLPVSFFIQIALLELIKSRRPVVHL